MASNASSSKELSTFRNYNPSGMKLLHVFSLLLKQHQFFSSSPFFQGLSHYVTDKCGDACPCISREDKGSSLRSCPVNRIEIQGFRATMKEMTLIKHFLDYFPSLKRLDAVVEDNEPTQLRNPELSKCVTEMFGLYNKLHPSCSVELMVSPFLQKKWREQGHI